MFADIRKGFQKIYTAFKAQQLDEDKYFLHTVALPLTYDNLKNEFVPLLSVLARLVTTEFNLTIRSTINETVVLTPNVGNSALICQVIVNAAGTASSITFRDAAGTTIAKIQTTTTGVTDLRNIASVHDFVTAGTAAADVTIVYLNYEAPAQVNPL